MSKTAEAKGLPAPFKDVEDIIRVDRLPHIWCPGCGLGIIFKTLAKAIKMSGIPPEKHVIVTGIGCTGRMGGYFKLDAYHVTHGRAIPFAVGLKIANPDLEVTVIGGDGDLLSIGGNHFIHAARRNDDINVILVTNYNYGMTGGQYAPMTPTGSKTSTSPYGHFEYPFNAPLLARAAGASFVARWTAYHYVQLLDAFLKMFKVRGFAFIEVLSPCILYTERNIPDGALGLMRMFREKTVINDRAKLEEIGALFNKEGKIVVGNFYYEEKPTYLDLARKYVRGG